MKRVIFEQKTLLSFFYSIHRNQDTLSTFIFIQFFFTQLSHWLSTTHRTFRFQNNIGLKSCKKILSDKRLLKTKYWYPRYLLGNSVAEYVVSCINNFKNQICRKIQFLTRPSLLQFYHRTNHRKPISRIVRNRRVVEE